MTTRPLADRTALVTGASSGIGAAIARALAGRGAHVIVSARRADRLAALVDELVAAGGRATAVTADLEAADGAAALWATARAIAPIDVLVNNAGFGHFRPFADVGADRDRALIALNVDAVVALSHAFVAAHRARPGAPRGGILNVASTLAYQSVPNFATYGASKAFVRNFSEALHYELRATIDVTCLCPGGTRTEFHGLAGAGNYGALASASLLDPAIVAERGVRGLLAGKKIVIPGAMNKLACWFARAVPRGVASRAATWITGAPSDRALPDRATPP